MIKNILISLFLFTQVLLADAATIELQARESATLSEGPIKVIVNLEKLESVTHCPSASSWRWGSEQACPSSRIASLEISFRNKSVFIPYSTFADLGNPVSLEIEQDNKGITYSVKIAGGDAATSYKATIKFKSDLLLEKIVRHGEFPDSAWEKRYYKFNLTESHE